MFGEIAQWPHLHVRVTIPPRCQHPEIPLREQVVEVTNLMAGSGGIGVLRHPNGVVDLEAWSDAVQRVAHGTIQRPRRQERFLQRCPSRPGPRHDRAERSPPAWLRQRVHLHGEVRPSLPTDEEVMHFVGASTVDEIVEETRENDLLASIGGKWVDGAEQGYGHFSTSEFLTVVPFQRRDSKRLSTSQTRRSWCRRSAKGPPRGTPADLLCSPASYACF